MEVHQKRSAIKVVKMKKLIIAVLLISVFSLSSFYAVAADERGYKDGYADIPSVHKQIHGILSTSNTTQSWSASSTTRIEDGGCCGIILTAKLDVKDWKTGQGLLGGEKS